MKRMSLYLAAAYMCVLGVSTPKETTAQAVTIESRISETPERTRARVTGFAPITKRLSVAGFFDAYLGPKKYSKSAKTYFGRSFANVHLGNVLGIDVVASSQTIHGTRPNDEGYAGIKFSYTHEDRKETGSSFQISAKAFPVHFGLLTSFEGDKTPLVGLRSSYTHTIGPPDKDGNTRSITYSIFGDINTSGNWDYGEAYITANGYDGKFLSIGAELIAQRNSTGKVTSLLPKTAIVFRAGIPIN